MQGWAVPAVPAVKKPGVLALNPAASWAQGTGAQVEMGRDGGITPVLVCAPVTSQQKHFCTH